MIPKLRGKAKSHLTEIFGSSPGHSSRILRSNMNQVNEADVEPGFLKRIYRHFFSAADSVSLDKLFDGVKEACETEYKEMVQKMVEECAEEIAGFIESVDRILPRPVLSEIDAPGPAVENRLPDVAFHTVEKPYSDFRMIPETAEAAVGALYPGGFAMYMARNALTVSGKTSLREVTVLGTSITIPGWNVVVAVAVAVTLLFTTKNYNDMKRRAREKGIQAIRTELTALSYEKGREVCRQFNEYIEEIIKLILTAFKNMERDFEKTVVTSQYYPRGTDAPQKLQQLREKIEKLLQPEVPDPDTQDPRIVEILEKIEGHLRSRTE